MILQVLLPIHLILAPAEIKKLVKSKISGSHAKLCKTVLPFARTAEVISCSDAPTLIAVSYTHLTLPTIYSV